MKTSYVIMTDTVCQGEIIGCHTEDDTGNRTPDLFDTEVEAWKEIADFKISELKQFVDGERELEHTDFSCDEWVEKVNVADDGLVCSEDGKILFDPKNETQ